MHQIDRRGAEELGMTVAEFRAIRRRAFHVLRTTLRAKGYVVPDTDEGFLMLMQRLGIKELLESDPRSPTGGVRS